MKTEEYSNLELEKLKKRQFLTKAFTILIACLIFFGWLFNPWLIQLAFKLNHSGPACLSSMAALGDSYGAFNALISGAAFLCLILTIKQQEEMIKLQTKAIEKQSIEIHIQKQAVEDNTCEQKKQAKIQRLIGQLNALPVLINEASESIKDPNRFQYVPAKSFSISTLQEISKQWKDESKAWNRASIYIGGSPDPEVIAINQLDELISLKQEQRDCYFNLKTAELEMNESGIYQ